MSNDNNLLANFNPSFLPPLGSLERAVLEKLADLDNHNSDGLTGLAGDKTPRDIIKILRRKYKCLISTEKEVWRSDDRHLSVDERLAKVARAESSYSHAEHSLAQVKREKKREDREIINKQEKKEKLKAVHAE
jgi:hypothetical protein